MKNKKLKLSSFTEQTMDENLMHNIYAGAPECGNTCDCTCSCDPGNTNQLNSNVNNASTNNRDTSFVSVAYELAISISPYF